VAVQEVGNNNSGLVKMLRALVLGGFSPDYEINGVADPFLQARGHTPLFSLFHIRY
jgi:hypothetical protein